MSSPNNQTLIEQYRRKIYRIAWRIEYREKKHKNHEFLRDYDSSYINSFTDSSDSTLYVTQLIGTLSSKLGQEIIYKIYVQDKTETQVAKELCISQQAVSKWKKKMLNQLYQKLVLQNC